MRILLDCDGVLADFVGGFLKTLRDIDGVPRTHEDVTQYAIEEALGLTPETTASVHAQISQRGWCLGLQPIIGALEGVKALREAGHDLVVVTAPWPKHETWHWERLRWLEELGFEEKSVVFTKRKELVTGDLLLEDNPKILNRWMQSHANQRTGILFDQPYNRHVHLMPRMFGWAATSWLLSIHTGDECRRHAGLLAIAQDVKMTAEGSFHREEGEQKQDVAILENALKEWRPTNLMGSGAWDDAVRDLITVALLESAGRERG